MAKRRRPKSDLPLMDLIVVLIFVLFLLSPFLAPPVYFIYVKLQEGPREERLRKGTEAAYAGTARKDLELARRALAAGNVAEGEARASRAQDKLGSPMLQERPADAVSLSEALEREHEKSFKPIRRKRGQERFGKAGAEVK